MMKKIFFLLFFPILCWASEFPKALTVPGGVAVVPVAETASVIGIPTVFYQNQRVLVKKYQQFWVAVVGIPLTETLGTKTLVVNSEKGINGIYFEVQAKEYPAQYLKIKNKRMVNPNAEDLKKIKEDTEQIKHAVSIWTEQQNVEMDFIPPVEGRLSSRFGLRRFFNNQLKKPHSGLDIAVPTGTPVKAPANAQVINTGNYYYNGNSIFLNHGQGLITAYLHLSQINVKTGQYVKKGDIIGKVGSTGRVTGAHLHWIVYLNQTKVDPALFIYQDMPRLSAIK